jgi:hypothetical protein
MRVVIDASPRIVEAFVGHEVQTVFDLGWQNFKDHVLVKQLQCDVFVTADRGFEHEHNLNALRFGIVIVHATRNEVTFAGPCTPVCSKRLNRSSRATLSTSGLCSPSSHKLNELV